MLSTKISNIPLPTKYKLLAFLTWFKDYRLNSVVLQKEKKYILAKEMGVSVNTFSKYWQLSKDLELIKKHGDHYQVIALETIIHLFFNDLTIWRHIRFWKGIESQTKTTYNELLERIKFAVFKNNCNQQLYFKRGFVEVKNAFENGKPVGKLLKSVAQKNNISISEVIRISKSENEFNAVTSAKHTANLLGFSTPTGNRLLNLWAKNNLIKRNIIHAPVNENTPINRFEYINKFGVLMCILGSGINLF